MQRHKHFDNTKDIPASTQHSVVLRVEKRLAYYPGVSSRASNPDHCPNQRANANINIPYNIFVVFNYHAISDRKI